MWWWQLWLVLYIKKLFKALFCYKLKMRCGLCAAAQMCLDSGKLAPLLSHVWTLSCGSGDGRRKGRRKWLWQGQDIHLYWLVIEHNALMQSNVLISASSKKKEGKPVASNWFFSSFCTCIQRGWDLWQLKHVNCQPKFNNNFKIWSLLTTWNYFQSLMS